MAALGRWSAEHERRAVGIPLEHEIRTPRLMLRRMTADDAPRLYEIQSNWNVTRMLAMASFPPDLDDIRQWLSPHAEEWASGTAYRFAAISEGRIIGCADVDGISSGTGRLGYWFDEAYWGRGLAGEAAAAVVRFMLEAVNLQRLLSGHAEDNPASGRILVKLGFQWIGNADIWSRSRQSTIKHCKYQLDT